MPRRSRGGSGRGLRDADEDGQPIRLADPASGIVSSGSGPSAPPPGPHGGDVVAVARWMGVDPATICDLSANLNPVAPAISPIVARSASSVGRYPDLDRATSALSEALGVTAERLVITNGGSEAIMLVAELVERGWVERPEFSLYERHLRTIDPDAGRWRSNPSSPLGRLASADDVAAVWDEAYWPLATGTWTRGDDDAWRIGSLTKLWACPGLRIGYAIAPDADTAELIRARQSRWSVNSLAATVIEELAPRSDLAGWSRAITERRRALVELLRSHDLEVRDTDACWVLVQRPGLREALLEHRVLVRDCASFGLHDWHRIAVPDDRAAKHLERALAAALS